jgi:hypothetical protein
VQKESQVQKDEEQREVVVEPLQELQAVEWFDFVEPGQMDVLLEVVVLELAPVEPMVWQVHFSQDQELAQEQVEELLQVARQELWALELQA